MNPRRSSSSLNYCIGEANLVGLKYWLPTEPFDYNWEGSRIGCNQVFCDGCKTFVRNTVELDSSDAYPFRRYLCQCESRDVYGNYVVGQRSWDDRESIPDWRCSGHRKLWLPCQIDGIEIASQVLSADIVSDALKSPPFIATGFRNPSFWVQRLYALLPVGVDIGSAVAAQLTNDDPAVASAAASFFKKFSRANGADQVAVVVERYSSRFRATTDPLYLLEDPRSTTKYSLYDRFLFTIESRLSLERDGLVVDQLALQMARRALLDGYEGDVLLYRLAGVDSSWFATNAVAIAEANPTAVGSVLYALKDFPENLKEPVISKLNLMNDAFEKAAKERELQELKATLQSECDANTASEATGDSLAVDATDKPDHNPTQD